MEEIATDLQQRGQQRGLLQGREVFGGAALQGNLQRRCHVQPAGTGESDELPVRRELGQAPCELERIASDSVHPAADHPKVDQSPGHAPQLPHVLCDRRTAMRVALVHDWLITYRGGKKDLSPPPHYLPGLDTLPLIMMPAHFPLFHKTRRLFL